MWKHNGKDQQQSSDVLVQKCNNGKSHSQRTKGSLCHSHGLAGSEPHPVADGALQVHGKSQK